MTNLNHNRPILKVIDDIRRERQRQAAPPELSGKIGKAIERAIPVGAQRDREIVHATAIAVLRHYGMHRDRRPLELLMEAVGDERSRVALTKWLCFHGPLAVDEGGTFKNVKGRPTLIAAATLDPYWKHYPKVAALMFDPIAELERVERRIGKYGVTTPGSRHEHLRKQLRSLIHRYRS